MDSESFSALSLCSEVELCNDPAAEVDELLLSSEKVFSDKDLLTLILLRVPVVRKLISFASVSKLWHSIITVPRFSLLRSSNGNGNLPLRTSGLFFQINFIKTGVPNYISYVPLDNDNINSTTSSPFRELPFALAQDPRISRIRIVHSSGGLLLCSSCPYVVFEPEFRYYVYNPTTNQLLALPKNNNSDHCFAAVLAFDPSKSSHYRVFLWARLKPAPDTFFSMKQFYIYSSETGTWRPSGQPFYYPHAERYLNNIVYCNGCIHWIHESESVPGTADTDVGKIIHYFNLDEERLETMPRPPIGLRSTKPMTFYMGVSQNHLHVVEVYASDNILNVYEMESNHSGWFIKYEKRKCRGRFLLSAAYTWSSQAPWYTFFSPRKFQSYEFIESLSCV